MYNIRQFKPSLYLLLMLGTMGFALASQSAPTALLGFIGIGCNAWLVYVGKFRPIPRVLANLVTLGATAYVANRVLISGQTAVLVIGQFLVLLQLIKLWEQRANRDYAQLLVLSLLLMVAAAISTASLLFGMILACYLFLSLYCCLLFHLKVEADAAKAAMAVSEDKISPEMLRHDQRYLSSSMRRLTGFVSAVAISTAVLVFLFFPRGSGAGVLGPVNFQGGQALTGFSEQVGFQKIAQIQQNQEVVAHMKVWRNGDPVRGTQTILLRGAVLDYYTGEGGSGTTGPWVWVSTRGRGGGPSRLLPGGEVFKLFEKEVPTEEWRQQIQFRRPIGTDAVFAMEGLVSIQPRGDMEIRINRADGVIRAPGRGKERPLEYEVVSRGKLDPPADVLANPSSGGAEAPNWPPPRQGSGGSTGGSNNTDGGGVPPPGGAAAPAPFGPGSGAGRTGRGGGTATEGPGGGGTVGEVFRNAFGAFGGARTPRPPHPKIGEFARRPEVSGEDDTGPLVARRPPDAEVTQLDGRIADNIEQYLKSNFTYTLDLTDARNIIEGQDPMVAFLYDLKRGHCEYFAGAMALMCQSLGMQARVVTGFKCDEYNEFIDQYVIRQAHAHAWVEVKTAEGWRTFDPTSGRESMQTTGTMGLWQKAKHLFNFLEFQYGNAVIAYDNEHQENLVRDMETGMTRGAWRGAEAVRRFREWIDSSKGFWSFSSYALFALVALLALAPLAMVLWVVVQRVRMHRRATRIGVESLPTRLQKKLVRQLGFYDDLLILLARHGIHRPAHQTPLEFSQSLGFLPAAAYEAINRLTELFYRVRFGQNELTPGQHKRVNTAVGEVADLLAKR